jgi:hypothetical protein
MKIKILILFTLTLMSCKAPKITSEGLSHSDVYIDGVEIKYSRTEHLFTSPEFYKLPKRTQKRVINHFTTVEREITKQIISDNKVEGRRVKAERNIINTEIRNQRKKDIKTDQIRNIKGLVGRIVALLIIILGFVGFNKIKKWI